MCSSAPSPLQFITECLVDVAALGAFVTIAYWVALYITCFYSCCAGWPFRLQSLLNVAA